MIILRKGLSVNRKEKPRIFPGGIAGFFVNFQLLLN